jgi:hypothetical protein
MKIKLFGALPQQLKDLNLKPGDIFEAYPSTSSTYANAVELKVIKDGEPQIATVYQENYKKL